MNHPLEVEELLKRFPAARAPRQYPCPFCPSDMRHMKQVWTVPLHQNRLYCSREQLDMHVATYHYPFHVILTCPNCPRNRAPQFLFQEFADEHVDFEHPEELVKKMKFRVGDPVFNPGYIPPIIPPDGVVSKRLSPSTRTIVFGPEWALAYRMLDDSKMNDGLSYGSSMGRKIASETVRDDASFADKIRRPPTPPPATVQRELTTTTNVKQSEMPKIKASVVSRPAPVRAPPSATPSASAASALSGVTAPVGQHRLSDPSRDPVRNPLFAAQEFPGALLPQPRTRPHRPMQPGDNHEAGTDWGLPRPSQETGPSMWDAPASSTTPADGPSGPQARTDAVTSDSGTLETQPGDEIPGLLLGAARNLLRPSGDAQEALIARFGIGPATFLTEHSRSFARLATSDERAPCREVTERPPELDNEASLVSVVQSAANLARQRIEDARQALPYAHPQPLGTRTAATSARRVQLEFAHSQTQMHFHYQELAQTANQMSFEDGILVGAMHTLSLTDQQRTADDLRSYNRGVEAGHAAARAAAQQAAAQAPQAPTVAQTLEAQQTAARLRSLEQLYDEAVLEYDRVIQYADLPTSRALLSPEHMQLEQLIFPAFVRMWHERTLPSVAREDFVALSRLCHAAGHPRVPPSIPLPATAPDVDLLAPRGIREGILQRLPPRPKGPGESAPPGPSQ